jgi:transposase
MAAGNRVFEEGIYPDVESRGVLPDPGRRQKLSWGQVKALVPKAERPPPLVGQEAIKQLLEARDKKKFGDESERLWPPRTKTDLALRRTRLLDWVKYFRQDGRMSDLLEVLGSSREGWDLIFITNLAVATAVFGLEWFLRWKSLGAFDADLAHYIAVTKKVHDLGKSTGLRDVNWTWYVECSTMSGYRNPPFPGFDVVAEAKALANGGDEHNYFGHSWRALCHEFLPMRYHQAPYVAFAEWVKSADWLTSGASSVGRLRLTTADGKAINIKARKNMVADVVDLGELAETALHETGQVNYTIIKSELGKLRLAVAGDIYTYLKMTWINGLLGGAYYDWPGNTSEESFTTQTKRMARMLELCAVRLGLPYDYAGFDHQPQTEEILGIVDVLCDHARLNVPRRGLREYDAIVSNVRLGFLNSTLEVREGKGLAASFHVEGGLMSGLRWTSVVGNAWNSVMTGLAMKLLVAWGMDVSQIERYIRGDDSAIFVPNWATGAAMNLAYDAVGAKAGAGKFSLQEHAMEFLRVWFDTRCRGYPARAIPGLTQRKPWSSQPWSEDMVIRALHEGIRTLRRRVSGREASLDAIWRTLRHVWCSSHNLPDAVCWAPVFAGGFGIEPQPVGESWRIEPPVPRANPSTDVVIDNQRAWRADRLRQYASEHYQLDIGERADRLAHEELLSTVTADSIPEVARLVRETWLIAVRRAGCRAHRTRVGIPNVSLPVAVNAYRPSQIEDLLQRLRAEAPLYGSCPEVEVARSDFARFRPSMSFRRWLFGYFPRIHVALRSFHKSWHLSEALDYLGGRLTLAPQVLHPALIGVLGWAVASVVKPEHHVERCTTLWVGGVLEPHIALSPISQITYWW